MRGILRSVVLLVVLLMALVLAACTPKPPATTRDLTVSTSSGTLLMGTDWLLTSLNGHSLIEGTEIALYFEGAFLGGSMTCNGYGGGPDSGKYLTTDDGTLTLPNPIAVTLQLCTTPQGIMEQEAAYIEALRSAKAYRVAGDRLEIKNAAGDPILVFARKAKE